MEVSIPILESGTHVRVHEEKMMMCSHKCEDNAFDDVGSKMHDDKLMICASNYQDGAFHMEVSPPKGIGGEVSKSGCDCVLDLKGNEGGVLDSNRDCVVGLNENDGVVLDSSHGCVVGLKRNDVGVSNSGIDGVVDLKGNEGVVSNLGCLKGNDVVVSTSGHDGVVGVKGNNEEVLDLGCDGVVVFKGNHGLALNSGHDGVVGSKGLDDVDVEVEIVHDGNVDEERISEMDPQDVTESSSSFGCTDDSGDGSTELSSDSEVESHFRADNTSFLKSKGFSDLVRPRKKKLTAHWRKFVRPLMWRCKWVELQLRELHSQKCKYDKELSDCEKRKQFQLEKCSIEELGLKSTPFNGHYRSVHLMKRKKRRRVEETVDLASYTSMHNMFSYYASRRSITGSVYMDDDAGSTDVAPAENSPIANNADLASLEFNGCDAFESILRKIEDAQVHARQLRLRMDKVVRENAGKFASSSTALGDQYATSAAPNSLLPCVLTPTQPMSEKKLMIPESLVLGSRGEVHPSNGIKGSEPAQSGGKLVKMELQLQTHSQPLPEHFHNHGRVDDEPTSDSQLATGVPDPNGERAMNGEQAGKLRSGSKMITARNRKRGRRSGRWSKKSSG